MRAVIILSGGLDSTTCMGIAQAAGYELHPLTYFYNQRHSKEVACAKRIAQHYGAQSRHKTIDLSFFESFGKSALTDINIDIPTSGIGEDIPTTYVPARNLIFLAVATAFAEVVGAQKIYIGVNAIDYSNYPDCRPEFIKAMEKTLNLATKEGVTSDKPFSIEAPLINLTKRQIIKWGQDLSVPYELTTSCYRGEEDACGMCDSCILRLKGFYENDVTDPISYRERILK